MSPMKVLHFVGTSLDDLKQFPVEAKRAAGFELWQVSSWPQGDTERSRSNETEYQEVVRQRFC